MTDSDEITMYIVIRSDLGMSKGKIAAQAGHAVHIAIRATEKAARIAREEFDPQHYGMWLHEWESGSYPKVVLKAESAEQLEEVATRLIEGKVLVIRVADEGRTEIPAGSLTAIATQPMPRSQLHPLLAGLKLL